MIDLLTDYIQDSLPSSGAFITNFHLTEKVEENGRFKPFYGNTVIFRLDDGAKKALATLQDELYCGAGALLAERIRPETFHMTLHDLANSPEYSDDLEHQMALTARKAAHLLTWWKEEPPLRLRATRIFNMVSTSIVLGLAPADRDTEFRLDAMYNALETVVPLGYALTPHITLAYYRPGIREGEELQSLRSVMKPVELELELRPEELCLQYFLDMNTYVNSI